MQRFVFALAALWVLAPGGCAQFGKSPAAHMAAVWHESDPRGAKPHDLNGISPSSERHIAARGMKEVRHGP
jgi:hypothetical protein